MVTVNAFTAVINQLLPEPHAGLLNGILFGTRAAIPKDFMDSLIKTSTLHIIALSGMNITILESLVADTLLRFVNRRITSMITVVIIIGFVWFVGVSASVVRAAIMGSLALLAVIFGRQMWSFLSFILTIGIMLLIKPAWIGDLSFQLSALATLGLILFGGKRVSASKESSPVGYLGHLGNLLKSLFEDDLRVTLAAQTFTIPLIFFTFRRISLVSPLTNILIGWTLAPLTAIGMGVAVLGWIFLPLGQLVAWVAWVVLQYMILVIEWTAKLPFSSLNL